MLQVFETPRALWRLTANSLVRSSLGREPESDLGAEISELLGQTDLSAGILPVIGMGRDIPDGNMTLRGSKLDIDWRKLKSGRSSTASVTREEGSHASWEPTSRTLRPGASVKSSRSRARDPTRRPAQPSGSRADF